MPICPKCGELISAKKYGRHLKRCGSTHKHVHRSIDQSDTLMKL